MERGAPERERLPGGAFTNIWSGPGCDQLCSGCSKPIGFDEVEIEVEIQEELAVTLKSSVLHFHDECYRIWSGEGDSAPLGGGG